MGKKSYAAIMIFTVLLAASAVCGCSGKDTALKDKLEEGIENGSGAGKTDEQNDVAADDGAADEEKGTTADLYTEESIRSYLAGEWMLLDQNTGDDFASLSLKEDGSFEFTRLKDNTSGSGKMFFEHMYSKEDEAPDAYRMEFDDFKDLFPEGAEIYSETDGISGGLFLAGSGEDEDLLYLHETGNGESAVAAYILNTNDNVNDFENIRLEWLFCRKAPGKTVPAPKEDESFYAWLWERDGNKVFLQPMTEHEFDTFDEYSVRAFTGGYFSEKTDIGITGYELDDLADVSGIMQTKAYDRRNPLIMVSVEVGADGKVTSMTDVDRAYYGLYDMGDRKPEFSSEGNKFIYNDCEYDMSDYAPASTAVMDCTQVGNWIIVDCHVNPHRGIYEFFNIDMGDFLYDLVGANFTWKGDDLSTGIYSDYGDVYDFWGNRIGTVPEGEVIELSFTDEGNVWAVYELETDGYEERGIEFEYEAHDSAVWSYYGCMYGGNKRWREFMKTLPAGAEAMVIVDPPQAILDRMRRPIEVEKGALDTVVVVSLHDDQKIHIEAIGQVDALGNEKNYGEFYDADRGDQTVFELTVPEGGPANTISVRRPGAGEVFWDVMIISGRSPEMSMILISGD